MLEMKGFFLGWARRSLSLGGTLSAEEIEATIEGRVDRLDLFIEQARRPTSAQHQVSRCYPHVMCSVATGYVPGYLRCKHQARQAGK